MKHMQALCLALLWLLSLGVSGEAEEAMYYRVVARDDSPAAQEQKLRAREAALRTCPENPGDLEQALPRITEAVNAAVGACRVELRSWQPHEKMPSALTLYITLGEGKGHNCWGLLYQDSLRLAQIEGDGEPGGETAFEWPFLEWLFRLIGWKLL